MVDKIQILITLQKAKIASVNQEFRASYKMIGGKIIPYVYKDPKVKQMVSEIQDELRSIDWNPYLAFLTQTKHFTVNETFIYKNGISKRDVSNNEKAVSDALISYFKNELGLKVDDSQFTTVILRKAIIPGSEHEHICIELSEDKTDVRFDHIQKPDVVWIYDKDRYKGLQTELRKVGVKITDDLAKSNAVIYINEDDRPFTHVDYLDVMDGVYKELDNGFLYYYHLGSLGNPLVNERINNIGGSNIKAKDIVDLKEIVEDIKNDRS